MVHCLGRFVLFCFVLFIIAKPLGLARDGLHNCSMVVVKGLEF